jgi:hypothetical protein
MNKNHFTSKQAAIGGIFAAMNIVLILMSSYIPIWKISILVIASLVTAAIVIELGIRISLIYYACVSLISMIITSFLPSVFEYVLLFGIYPILKYYFELIRNFVIQYIVKIISFNILFSITYFLLNTTFLTGNFSTPIIFIIGNIIFVIYDFVLSGLISYYYNRIKKHIRL